MKATFGEKFKFASPVKEMALKEESEQTAFYRGRDFAMTPSAFKFHRSTPGMEMYFALGFELNFGSNLSPFLSWGEGTVDAGNPTAPSNWVMVSFQADQVPVLLVFDKPVQLIAEGSSGEWRVRTTERYKGWVRAMLPIGLEKIGMSVAGLGQTVNKVKANAKYLTQSAPELVSVDVRSEESALVAIWNYDKPGAIIPIPLMLCKQGGYGVKILTGVTPPVGDLDYGPLAFSTEPRIAVRFPIRRVPVGRGLSVGTVPDGLTTVNPFDVPSVTELALKNLVCRRDLALKSAVDSVRTDFQRLSAQVNSSGAPRENPDILAAHALLEESIRIEELTEAPNSFLAELLKTFDASRWVLTDADSKPDHRATGLAAFAAALSDDQSLRLRAAMLHAGLVAEKVLPIYQEKRGFEVKKGEQPDPLASLRLSLFSDATVITNIHPYVASLLGHVRVLSPIGVTVEPHEKGYRLSWIHRAGAPQSLVLLTGYPIEIEAETNLVGVKPSTLLGSTMLSFQPKEQGTCSVIIRLPAWASPLPVGVPTPGYSE
ncbi:MAG: hypothetical protein KDC26_03325 [Armatimonadetes bacterium]|nr:hypothetical protein [Armatimonadota bacterium]